MNYTLGKSVSDLEEKDKDEISGLWGVKGIVGQSWDGK